MAIERPSFPAVVLFSSLLLNLYFTASHLFRPGAGGQLRWSFEAALEAEAAASIPCSGNGEAFVDGIHIDGVPVCECYPCYRGPDCSEPDLNCVANVDSGDPLYLEPYWKRHAKSSAVVIPGWHRMSYSADSGSVMTLELERHIRLLHSYVGNAVTEGRYIVIGTGATQLMNALVHALSPDNATSPARVVSAVPYYGAYRTQTQYFDSKAYQWDGATAINTSRCNDAPPVIEFVNSPNNPDGLPRSPVLNCSSVIYDHVYYWPHYSPIRSKVDGDAMLFSMTKLSGHAGSRLGWAIIRSEEIYRKVLYYTMTNNMGSSRDTQSRMLRMIRSILEQRRGDEGDIFRFGFERMRMRWKRLRDIVASSTGRFSLQSIGPEYCNYFEKLKDPSPAYAWLKCEWEEDEDCYGVLSNGGIIGRDGARFGASKRFTRLSMLVRESVFEKLLEKLKSLVGPGAMEQTV